MKRITVLFPAIILCSLLTVNAISVSEKTSPVGLWKFDAPHAPAGYVSGRVNVLFADSKYAVIMKFSSSEYKYKGEKVKFENDTLSFSIYVEGESVVVTMKMETAKKMLGKAVYSEGVVEISMVKDESE